MPKAGRRLPRAISTTSDNTAEAVGCDDESDRFGVLDLLTRLVDKSLVQVDHEDPESRYRMLADGSWEYRCPMQLFPGAMAVKMAQAPI